MKEHKQHVLVVGRAKVLMWDDGDIIIESEAESVNLSISELLYIIQEYQEHLGPIKVKADTSNWRGFYGSVRSPDS